MNRCFVQANKEVVHANIDLLIWGLSCFQIQNEDLVPLLKVDSVYLHSFKKKIIFSFYLIAKIKENNQLLNWHNWCLTWMFFNRRSFESMSNTWVWLFGALVVSFCFSYLILNDLFTGPYLFVSFSSLSYKVFKVSIKLIHVFLLEVETVIPF